jgi:Zn-finger nucleic acid-binding protein
MRTGTGVIWRCEKCDGRAVGLQLLRRTFTPESVNPLWLHAIHNEGSIARPCPSCSNPMIEVALESSSGIKVEVCRICEFVWFDAGETQPLQVRPLPKPPPAPLPQKAREAIAWRKCSSSPSGRVVLASTAHHRPNGGNQSQLFLACQQIRGIRPGTAIGRDRSFCTIRRELATSNLTQRFRAGHPKSRRR